MNLSIWNTLKNTLNFANYAIQGQPTANQPNHLFVSKLKKELLRIKLPKQNWSSYNPIPMLGKKAYWNVRMDILA